MIGRHAQAAIHSTKVPGEFNDQALHVPLDLSVYVLFDFRIGVKRFDQELEDRVDFGTFQVMGKLKSIIQVEDTVEWLTLGALHESARRRQHLGIGQCSSLIGSQTFAQTIQPAGMPGFFGRILCPESGHCGMRREQAGELLVNMLSGLLDGDGLVEEFVDRSGLDHA